MERILQNELRPHYFYTPARIRSCVLPVAARFPAIIYKLNEVSSNFTIKNRAKCLNFANLLNPPPSMNTETIRKHYSKVVTYLYYHGILTLSKPFAGHSMTFKVPNRVAHEELNRLTNLRAGKYSMANFLQNPSADDLAEILN
jgi:hypothetical protein